MRYYVGLLTQIASHAPLVPGMARYSSFAPVGHWTARVYCTHDTGHVLAAGRLNIFGGPCTFASSEYLPIDPDAGLSYPLIVEGGKAVGGAGSRFC
jgi:hypothetical protein